jgi:hypothetical protein
MFAPLSRAGLVCGLAEGGFDSREVGGTPHTGAPCDRCRVDAAGTDRVVDPVERLVQAAHERTYRVQSTGHK